MLNTFYIWMYICQQIQVNKESILKYLKSTVIITPPPPPLPVLFGSSGNKFKHLPTSACTACLHFKQPDIRPSFKHTAHILEMPNAAVNISIVQYTLTTIIMSIQFPGLQSFSIWATRISPMTAVHSYSISLRVCFPATWWKNINSSKQKGKGQINLKMHMFNSVLLSLFPIQKVW